LQNHALETLLTKVNTFFGYEPGEHYPEIKEDLDNLIKLGVQIESITTEGHKSILKAIKKSIPDVLAQNCHP
jgi:hypothetical protein